MTLVPFDGTAVSTYTGTWGALDNGFSADMAFRTCFPVDRWVEFLAHLEGRAAPRAKFFWNGIDYPAQGFGINSVLSMDESCEAARINGINSIRRFAPGRIKHILSGYSQGSICSYLLAHEFLPGKALQDYYNDLLLVVNFGDPTCPPGRYADGWGITRYLWDPRLEPLLLSYNNQYDMYGRAPEDTYLHIGFLALKQFKLDFMSMIKIMGAMIQNDEFVDAMVELLPPGTAGLLETVMELTGLGSAAAANKIATAKPVTGGILGQLKGGVDITAMITFLPAMAGGFLTGFLGGFGLGGFGKIIGGLLGGGSGSGGTTTGWNKMGKTFAWLLQFAITGAHGRYADPAQSNWNGMTALDDSVSQLWRLAAYL